MGLTRRTTIGVIVGAATLAGCLNGNGGAATDTTTEATTETASPASTATETSAATGTSTGAVTTDGESSSPTVGVASHPELGDVLVGPDGMTLYMFDRDTKGAGESSCYDSCAQSWPPLTVPESPTTGEAVTATVDTFEREDGARQVTAGGWPLYYYGPDENPGDATGQGVGDVWWVLAPDGTPIGRETTTGDGGY